MADDTLNLDLDVQDLTDKFLTFFVESQVFCLPIAHVIEIVQIQPITPMPELPYYIKGVINMRGQVIPVIDINLRFGKVEKEYTDRTCIIVLELDGMQTGVIVDAVEAVLDIPADTVSPPPNLADRGAASYVIGIGKMKNRMVLVLDSRRLVSDSALSMDMFAGMENIPS